MKIKKYVDPFVQHDEDESFQIIASEVKQAEPRVRENAFIK